MSMPSSLALALALSDRALSQPWSAAGGLNAILTFDAWAAPSSVAALVAVAAGVVLEPLLSSPPQATMPKPRATPAHITGTTFLNFMWHSSSLDYRSVIPFLPAAALQQHGGEDDPALCDGLDLDGQVRQREQVEHDGERDDAEHRPADGCLTTGEARTADHHRGDRVELVELTGDGRSARQPATQQDRGDTG